MSDARHHRWVHGPHLRLELRSAVAIAASAPPAAKARAVAALQSGGGRGAFVQKVLRVPFARLPAGLAACLPRVHRTPDAGLAVPAEQVIAALEHADTVLDHAISDVVWLLPPPSDGARLSALLLDGATPRAHLRITDRPPSDRPDPATPQGTRTGIEWPVMLAGWERDGVVVELTTAFDLGVTTPTELTPGELDDLLADLRDTLGPGPDGLLAAHGDLTPWNLRTTADGRRVLLDWEHRTYAPDGVDLVRFLVASPGGVARFRRLPADRRRAARAGITFLEALADERDAMRSTDELTGWKRADIAAERATLAAMAAAARA